MNEIATETESLSYSLLFVPEFRLEKLFHELEKLSRKAVCLGRLHELHPPPCWTVLYLGVTTSPHRSHLHFQADKAFLYGSSGTRPAASITPRALSSANFGRIIQIVNGTIDPVLNFFHRFFWRFFVHGFFTELRRCNNVIASSEDC